MAMRDTTELNVFFISVKCFIDIKMKNPTRHKTMIDISFSFYFMQMISLSNSCVLLF